MLDAGLSPPDHMIADGLIHSFPTNDKPSDRAGRYCLFDDGLPAGWFKDWRTGVEASWHDNNKQLSKSDRQQQRKRMKAIQQKRKEDAEQRKIDGIKKAEKIYNHSDPVTSHPYLIKKGVQACQGLRRTGDRLIIPVRNAIGELQSLQFINNSKLYMKGGIISGGYFSIGDVGDVLCIAEGYATSASIHEATGYAVAVAFDTNNLINIAKVMRGKFPNKGIIICADDDHRNEVNIGLKKATEAAKIIDAEVILPDFGDNRPSGATDFNDLHALKGLGAVRDSFLRKVKHQGFSLIWAGDIKTDLTDEYVIKGVLSRGAMSVVYGESNSGKSFFAIDMAMQIASGMNWRDRKTKQGIVLYVASESPKGVETRVNAFIKHVSKDSTTPLAVIRESVDLLGNHDSDRIIALCNELERQHKMPVSLVIFDTLARSMAGGNENAFDDMSRIVGNADMIRHTTNAHVMLIHHTGKDTAKGARGHSSLRAATDTEIEVFASESNGQKSHTAAVTKQREYEGGDEFYFTLNQVLVGYDDDGDKITTCTVEISQSGASKNKKGRLGKNQQIAYDALILAEKASRITPNVVVDDWNDAFRTRFRTLNGKDPVRQRWHECFNALLDKGLITHNKENATVRIM